MMGATQRKGTSAHVGCRRKFKPLIPEHGGSLDCPLRRASARIRQQTCLLMDEIQRLVRRDSAITSSTDWLHTEGVEFMKRLVEIRSQEFLCRERALRDSERKIFWLTKAEEWE